MERGELLADLHVASEYVAAARRSATSAVSALPALLPAEMTMAQRGINPLLFLVRHPLSELLVEGSDPIVHQLVEALPDGPEVPEGEMASVAAQVWREVELLAESVGHSPDAVLLRVVFHLGATVAWSEMGPPGLDADD